MFPTCECWFFILFYFILQRTLRQQHGRGDEKEFLRFYGVLWRGRWGREASEGWKGDHAGCFWEIQKTATGKGWWIWAGRLHLVPMKNDPILHFLTNTAFWKKFCKGVSSCKKPQINKESYVRKTDVQNAFRSKKARVKTMCVVQELLNKWGGGTCPEMYTKLWVWTWKQPAPTITGNGSQLNSGVRKMRHWNWLKTGWKWEGAKLSNPPNLDRSIFANR